MDMAEIRPICGIYKIVNKKSNRVYIGRAEFILKRWTDHVATLLSGTHHNKDLQGDFALYGLSGFEFHIVEECPKEFLIKRENFHIRHTLLPQA